MAIHKSRYGTGSAPIPQNSKNGGFSTQIFGRCPSVIGMVLVLLILSRVTLISYWASSGIGYFLVQGSWAALIAAFTVIVFAKGNIHFSLTGFCLLAVTSLGCIFSDYSFQSLSKWAGWGLIFVIAGPFIQGRAVRDLKFSVWETFRVLFISIGFLSFFWYILGLPVMGRGLFTGVMVHSMLLAPMAAMAVIFCTHKALLNRSIIYGAFGLVSLISCLLAGSRSATISLVFSLIVLFALSFFRATFRQRKIIIFCASFILIIGGLFYSSFLQSDVTYRYTYTMQEKGLENTRVGLWAARWAEFNESPIVGVGIGMGTVKESGGVIQSKSGDINIEPGSSYLALLSMTGILGALGFTLVAGRLFRTCFKNLAKFTEPEIVEVLAVLAFFSLHLGAEGYIFAAGNSLCLFFWLALGRLQDLLTCSKFETKPSFIQTEDKWQR